MYNLFKKRWWVGNTQYTFNIKLSWTSFDLPKIAEIGNYATGLYINYLNCIAVATEMKKLNEDVRLEASKDAVFKAEYDKLEKIIREYKQILPKLARPFDTPAEFRNEVVKLVRQKREKIIREYKEETQERLNKAQNNRDNVKSDISSMDMEKSKNAKEQKEIYESEIKKLKHDLDRLDEITLNGEDGGLVA